MRKILEITADQFMKMGISTSKYTTASGLFWRAAGIDPFIIPGTLMGGYNPSQIGAAVVTETIKYFLPTTGSGKYIFGYGDGGDIYRIDISTDAVELLTTVASSVGNGFELFKGKIYYASNASLGEMSGIEDATPTFSTVGSFTNSISDHPLHAFAEKLYCGDGDHLDSYDGSTFSDNVLDLPSDYTIIDIDDDGYYIVIAAVKKTGGLTRTTNKLFFWDGTSSSWNVEWDLPEGELTGISKAGRGNLMVAFAGSGMYFFSVASAPEIFVDVSSNSNAPFTEADFQPFSGALHFWRGNIAWASNGKIFAYGRVLFNAPKIITTPISLSNIKSFHVDAFNRIYASTTDNKLYKLASGNVDASFETGLIDLKRPYSITRVKLFLVDPLSATSSVQVQLTNEDVGTAVFDKTFDSATYGTTKRSFWADVQMEAKGLRAIVTLNGGAIFKKLEIYGIPISNETTI